jgi:iron complex outermembrane receptor protein
VLEPTDNIRNVTIVDSLTEAASPYAIIATEFLPGGSGALVGGPANANRLVAEQQALGPWRFATPAFSGMLPQDVMNPAFCEPGSSRPFTQVCNRNFNKSAWLKTFGVVNRTEVDLGFATLKNIASYRRFKRSTFQSSWWATFTDGTGGTGNQSITGSTATPIETLTEELQLTGLSFDNRLNWSTGAFYLHDRGMENNVSFQGIGLTIPTSQNIAPSWLRTNSWGLYGQGTFAATDKLNLTAGIRYSSDKKKAWRSDVNYNVANGAITCNLFGADNVRLPADPSQCMLRGEETWDAITWNLSVDYKLRPGTMAYGTISRGYRSGGFFPRAIRPSLFDYGPEYITNFELGMKSDWTLLDRPIRTNLSLYLANQTDMQVQVQDVSTTPLSGYINNAGKARYWGGEFETSYRPMTAMTLTGFASYTDFKFSKYVDNNGTDLSYQTAPQPISHWTLGGSAEYRFDLADDSAVTLRADLSWNSKVVTDNRLPNLKGDWNQPAYEILNLRADWTQVMGRPVDLAIWGTNLTNDWYSWGGTCLSGSCYQVPSPPRMWGVDVKYHF